jgi:DNA-binding MarR family transcriptional regulator
MDGTVRRPLDATENQLWRSFLKVATRSLDRLDRELRQALGLSLADYEILVHLSESDGDRLSMSDLAARALLSQSRLTYRVDRLEQRGLVERIPCRSDGRKIWARLTPFGYLQLDDAYPIHLEGVRHYVIDPPSRDDLAAACRALSAMQSALDDRGGQPADPIVASADRAGPPRHPGRGRVAAVPR